MSTLPKTDAPTLNRHERRKAAKAKAATQGLHKKAYRDLYYHFRGRYLAALNSLVDRGLLKEGLGADGKRYWRITEGQWPGGDDLPPVPKGHREGFLTDPEVLAYICDYLKMPRMKHRDRRKK
jgi:hypothetical protein